MRTTRSPRRCAATRRPAVFVAITWLLVVEFVLGIGALAVPVMLHLRGDAVPLVVWMRLVVVLAMTTTLFYFAWRAQRGYYWAYSRLRLFSKIFPVVALVTAAIPGLYPLWMVTEQIFFSLILLGIAEYLSTDHMREAYAKPPKLPRDPKTSNTSKTSGVSRAPTVHRGVIR